LELSNRGPDLTRRPSTSSVLTAVQTLGGNVVSRASVRFIARRVRHHLVVMGPELSPWSLRAGRPSLASGVVVAVACVGFATLVIYPLSQIAPFVSLSVVYLPAVVVVSAYWGLRLGVATTVASAAAFNFFHLPPVGTLSVADRRDWAALAAFVVVAVATGLIAELARVRAQEADERRREADLAAELAQVLLGGLRVDEALAVAAKRLAAAIGVDGAALELAPVTPTDRQVAFALRGPGHGVVSASQIGTLLLPATLSIEERERVAARVVPALESILSAALHRATLQAEVVETAALRRSDEMKTAVLRSVSHDLRTPVTAILTAASALDPEHSTPEDVGEVRDVVTHAGRRLARLIEKVLDLTALQSGTLEPRRDWYSIEEVLSEATVALDAAAEVIHTSVAPDIPLLQGDAGRLERAFGNLLENAVRYSGGQPVVVLVRTVGPRVRVRIVDQGPGISAQEQERIFLPFYRSSDNGSSHEGSGLGLAIAKGFINAGGGELRVESLPGQGTSFVVDLPMSAAAADLGSASSILPDAPVADDPVATEPS
jgi:two-component system, OmpR family, sensor histidine kinase KdpD